MGDLICRLKTFNFQFPSGKDPDANFRLFARGVELWTNHKLLEAKAVLKQLYRSDLGGELANHTAVALLGVLLALQDYDEIERLKLSKNESLDASEIGLALAFQKFPQEKYSFADLENTFDFEFSQTGCPMIEVKVNGVSKRLWLDTGASTSVLSRSTADECGIKDGDSSLTATADNTQFEVGANTAYAKDFTIGNLTIANHPLVVIPDKMLLLPDPKTKGMSTIDGIVGWNAIRNMNLSIDYKRKIVKISKPIFKSSVLSTMFTAVRPIVNLRTKDQQILRFGLDTGASFSSISEEALTDDEFASVESRITTIATVGGTRQMQSRQVTNLALYTYGGKKLALEKLKVLPNLSDWATFFEIDGVLGGDAFRNLVLNVDFASGTVKVHNAG